MSPEERALEERIAAEEAAGAVEQKRAEKQQEAFDLTYTIVMSVLGIAAIFTVLFLLVRFVKWAWNG